MELFMIKEGLLDYGLSSLQMDGGGGLQSVIDTMVFNVWDREGKIKDVCDIWHFVQDGFVCYF